MAVKRKTPEHEVDLQQPSRKRSRSRERSPSIWSEQSMADPEIIEVPYPPPPKSLVQRDRSLTFPMSRCSPAVPACEGPKMNRFAVDDVKVRFVRELGNNAMDSNVFEVLIDEKPYALKLFRTWSTTWLPHPKDWGGVSHFPGRKRVAEYSKPFNCECRAYARIRERQMEDRIWKCYGYVRLPSEMRNELYQITGLPAHYWQLRPIFGDRYDKPTNTAVEELDWPIYGLVKELAPHDLPPVHLKSRNVRTMVNDLKRFHRSGIIIRDIADRNYIGGRIIDFSRALTLPHIWFLRPEPLRRVYNWPESFEAGEYSDMWDLETMVVESGVKQSMFRIDPEADRHAIRTREGRAWMQQNKGRLIPLYQLGVNEPEHSVAASFRSDIPWNEKMVVDSDGNEHMVKFNVTKIS